MRGNGSTVYEGSSIGKPIIMLLQRYYMLVVTLLRPNCLLV